MNISEHTHLFIQEMKRRNYAQNTTNPRLFTGSDAVTPF